MQIMHTSPAYDTAVWNHPWLAVIGTWPDKGPPQMTFGKRVGAAADPEGRSVTAEAQAGDVVRWGQKAKAPAADGTFATQSQGWGIVDAGGVIQLVSQDTAKDARRRLHPEDANAAPITFSKGAKATGKAKGARKGLHAGQVAAIAAKAAGGAPTAPAQAHRPKPPTTPPTPDQLAARLLESVGGNEDEVQATLLVAWARQLVAGGMLPTTAPVLPVAPVPVRPAPMAPMGDDTPGRPVQLDVDGVPLF